MKMEQSQAPAELVVYDVDGTMIDDIPGQCTGQAFWRMNKMGLLTPNITTLDELLAAQELLDENEIEPTDAWLHHEYSSLIVSEFDSNVGGLRERDVKRIFKELAKAASQMIYPEILDHIKDWKGRGATQALISGSPDPFVQKLIRELDDFEFGTGTRFNYRQGRVDKDRPPESRGSEKHLIVNGMRQGLGRRLGRPVVLAAAYGDSMGDYSMMLAARQAFAVNPKPELRAKAEEHGWDIIDTTEPNLEVA